MNFCVWRCIPDVSVERDVFHIHQLLLPFCSSWGRFVRVPWTSRRSNQSILKHITPEYSLEGLMLKLKRQYFGDLMWRTDSLEKTLMLGKMEGRKRRGWQRMKWLASPTQWTWVWASSGNRWCTGKPGVLQTMGLQRVRHDRETEQNRWIIKIFLSFLYFLDELKPSLAARLIPLWWQRSVRKCVLCLVYQVWSRHTFPWANYTSFNQNLAGFLKLSLSLWATNFREDWQKQYKNWTLAI